VTGEGRDELAEAVVSLVMMVPEAEEPEPEPSGEV
jgi:hypothetical protein